MMKEKDSFYRTEVKKTIYRMYLWVFIVGICSVLLFMSIGFLIARNKPDFMAMVYMSPTLLVYFSLTLLFLPGARYYKKIERLLDEENETELIRIARKINVRGSIALSALYDLSPSKVKPILDEYHVKGINQKTDMGFIKKITKLILEEEAIEKSIPYKSSEIQTIIPITKAYFIKNRGELRKGMISKTQLTLDYEVIICPYCSNMAKKDLMAEWLKERNTCPVCLTQIIIDDCPLVDIKDT